MSDWMSENQQHCRRLEKGLQVRVAGRWQGCTGEGAESWDVVHRQSWVCMLAGAQGRNSKGVGIEGECLKEEMQEQNGGIDLELAGKPPVPAVAEQPASEGAVRGHPLHDARRKQAHRQLHPQHSLARKRRQSEP